MRRRDVHEHDEEEHDIAHDEVLNRHQHNERNHDDDDRAHVVVEQPPIPVRRPPRDQHNREPDGVRRARHERRARTRVPEPGHDGREREDDAVDGDVDRDVREAPEPRAPVSERGAHLRAAEVLVGALAAVRLVRDEHDVLLGGGEEARGAWVGGHDEEGEEAEPARDAAFDDEDPSVGVAFELATIVGVEAERGGACAHFQPAIPYVPSRECIAVARRPPNAPVRDTVE